MQYNWLPVYAKDLPKSLKKLKLITWTRKNDSRHRDNSKSIYSGSRKMTQNNWLVYATEIYFVGNEYNKAKTSHVMFVIMQ